MKNSLYLYGSDAHVPAHLNFGKFLLDWLRKHDGSTAYIQHNLETSISVSYRELAQSAVNIADALTKLGVKKGHMVGLGTEESVEFLPTLLGVVMTGATVTPFEIECGQFNLNHKLNMIKPNFMIGSELFLKTYETALIQHPFIEKIIGLDDEPNCDIYLKKTINGKNVDVDSFEPAEVNGQQDVAMVMYSSGTTGMPKGVMMTHLNCILYSSPDFYKNITLQRIWILSHWIHNCGLFKTVKCMAAGKTLLHVPVFRDYYSELPKYIQQYKVEMIIVSPTILLGSLKLSPLELYNLDSLKIIYTRSSPLPVQAIDEAMKRFPKLEKVMQGYGITEAGEPSSQFAAKDLIKGSVGVLSEGTTFKVVDPKSRKVLGPNQHGELCVSGPVIMKGYVGMEPSSYLDEEGFFKTGDLGYYDDDRNIYVIDRIKEIVVCCGFNVHPSELESLLLTHPAIREVGVVGRPDLVEFEVPVAFVVRKPGTTVTEEELLETINPEIPHYKKIRAVKFINEIPRNVRGKIMRSRLKEMLKED